MESGDYRLLDYFVAIVGAGSLRGAAQRLGVSAPVVSTALADLEARLGTTLLERARRGAIPTADGATLFAAASRMVAAAETAMASVGAAIPLPQGVLDIAAPADLCLAWLTPRLRDFQVAHPAVQPILHVHDNAARQVPDGAEVVLRATYAERNTGAAVAHLPLALVAAPGTLRPGGTLEEQLARLPLIGFAARQGGSILAVAADGRARRIAARTEAIVNSGAVARDLALAGLGAALLPLALVETDLAAGRLAPVDPAHGFGWIAVRLHLRDRQPSAAARAFAAFLNS
jgi:DNA-binding transcriptional LysR family regulator